MISYAQNHEDVLLERVFREVKRGFYVDVGANDPTLYSVTRHFYDKGWRGINVEPSTIFHRLRQERTRDINLNVAVSDRCGPVTFYETTDPDTGTSSLARELSEALKSLNVKRVSRTVEAMTLAAILEEYAPPEIDFMSIDVEGHEREVLLGNEWSRFRPRVLVIEATLPCTAIPCHDMWEDVVLAADYVFAFFDGLNRYYVRKESPDLLERLTVPVNVLDNYTPAENQRLQRDLNEVGEELNELRNLLRDTGARSLHMMLWVARVLHRVHSRLLHRRRSAPGDNGLLRR